MSGDPNNPRVGAQFDTSRAELDRVARRAAIRRQLKAEFNRINDNPYRHVYNVEIVSSSYQTF